MKKKPLIMISSCLLGNNVRYNGGHTEMSWITKSLSKFVDFLPVCPEMEMGMGTPREQIHVEYVSGSDKLKLITKSGKDVTDKMEHFLEEFGTRLKSMDVDGVILMSKSPSCGYERVKHYNPKSRVPDRNDKGLFAKFLSENLEEVPVIDSGRLNNEKFRELFLAKVFAYYRFTCECNSISEIQSFHRDYKYLLMSHSQDDMRSLGRVASNIDIQNKDDYLKNLMRIMSIERSNKNKLNSLLHMMGYFKKKISYHEKTYIHEVFEDAVSGKIDFHEAERIVHYLADKYEVNYIKRQFYFDKFPLGLLSLRAMGEV